MQSKRKSRRRLQRSKNKARQAEVIRTALLALRQFARFYSDHQTKLTQVDKEILQRYASQMPEVDALVLVVLKGHLLLEEMLTSVISSFLPHPEFVPDLRLMFDRKLTLAKTLSWDQHENRIWDLIGGINTLRNDIAHNLESPKRGWKLNKLRVLYLRHFPQDTRLSDEKLLRGAIEFCMGFLSRCISEAVIFRRWIQTLTQLSQAGATE